MINKKHPISMLSILLMIFNLIESTYLTYSFATNPTHYNGIFLFMYYHTAVFGYVWTLYVATVMTIDQWIPVVTPFMRVGFDELLKTKLGQKSKVICNKIYTNMIVTNYLNTVKLYGDLLMNQIAWVLQTQLRQHSVLISETLKNWGLTKIEISQLKNIWEH